MIAQTLPVSRRQLIQGVRGVSAWLRWLLDRLRAHESSHEITARRHPFNRGACCHLGGTKMAPEIPAEVQRPADRAEWVARAAWPDECRGRAKRKIGTLCRRRQRELSDSVAVGGESANS